MREIDKLKEIKVLMKSGQISFDDAKKIASPLLKEMNTKASKIAKKFNRKHKDFTFTSFMR